MELHGMDPGIRPAAEWCLMVARHYGINVAVTSIHRSEQHQADLYRRYQACLARGSVYAGNPDPACRYPANPPGQSAHNYGLAWDSICPSRYQKWWNEVRRYAGFHVPNNDQIHAEFPNWREYV